MPVRQITASTAPAQSAGKHLQPTTWWEVTPSHVVIAKDDERFIAFVREQQTIKPPAAMFGQQKRVGEIFKPRREGIFQAPADRSNRD